MAIYKPTNCTPFLTTFDCQIEAADDPVFFECRIDSSNRNAVGYSVTVYDENNDQVFPPNTAESGQPPVYPAPDEHISQVSDLKRITGTGNAATETPYMIQSSGYTNLNTGINGSYLKFPFFLNSGAYPDSASNAGLTTTDQNKFYSSNAVYCEVSASGSSILYWYSPDSGKKIPVDMYNGNTYKWVITLYQGDASGVTPIPVSNADAYKYFDMQLTTGEIMGSFAERIQTVYSDEVYIDYYIEPIKIAVPSDTKKPSPVSPDLSNPTNWSIGDGEIVQTWTRTRIKNIDPTYGYLYPQIDDYSFDPAAITRGQANAYRVYQMGNDPEVLSTTRKVDKAVQMGLPLDWYNMGSDSTTSYGQMTFHTVFGEVAQKITSSNTTGSGSVTATVQAGTMSSTAFSPWFLTAMNTWEVTKDSEGKDVYASTPVVRWFCTSRSNSISTDERILLAFQVGADNEIYYGDLGLSENERPFIASQGLTTATITNNDNGESAWGVGSAYNGIYSTRFSDEGEVRFVFSAPPAKITEDYKPTIYTFNTYKISWDRTSDAATWGDLSTKIVMVQHYYGEDENVQTNIREEDGTINNGTINVDPFAFIPERPIQLYSYTENDFSTTNELKNNTGIIFYNGGEWAGKENEAVGNPENKLYISPFIGVKRGMYWIEQGNKSALEKRRFIIKYVDEKYWYVTYDDGTTNGTYPDPLTLPERETPYVIKSYFRDSDENPFDLYENPTIDLKVYRDEEHTYDADATAPKGKYEETDPDPQNPLYYMDPNTKDGSYCLEENYGQTSIVLLRVDRRSIWVEAEYNQSDFISWRSAQWFLYDGVSTNGNLLQSTDTYFDGKLGHQFYGLEENHVYTIVLILETNSGLTLSKDIQIITDFNIADVTNFPFTLEYQCETHSVYMFGLSGFILPNLTGAAKGDRVQDPNNEDNGTSPEIKGVTYSDYDNGQGWMNIDGTNANFPDEGVTYQYIVSVLNGEEAAATQMSSKEDEGTFTFESRHIVDAANSWGNIVGFQYISDEEVNDAFSSNNQAQIFLPNYNTTYAYDNVEYDYIDDKLLYQMRYQVGDFEGIPTIVDKDTGATISTKGIWGIETSGENKTTTAPLIVSGWLQEGLSSSDIGYAVRPSGYEVIAINETNAHYSPIEDGSGDHYKESRFDFLGDNESANSDDPIVAWSRRSTIYRNFTVPPKNDPTSEDGGEAGHLYQGPEDGTFHNFQVRTAVNANSWTNYQVIGTNPSLWSDNELERKTITTGGNRTLTWGADGETVSYGNITTQSREVENLDSHWIWDDGSGEHDVDNTAYDVSSANAKFWVDGDDNGTLKLYHQTEYASSSSSSAAWSTTDLRTGMDKYDFTFHMAVKNAFVGATEDDIQVQVFRGNAQDNTD